MRFSSRALLLLSALGLLTACVGQPPAPPVNVVAPSSFGVSKKTAVEVCMPPGERAYLSRLVCSGGATPSFRRVGSLGPRNPIPESKSKEDEDRQLKQMMGRERLAPGEADHHIIDEYEVSCGAAKSLIYMDMYHCQQPVPDAAPNGFGLKAAN